MSKVVDFWKILFDEGEFTCYGNHYETKVKSVPVEEVAVEEFFCINPLDKSRDHGYFMKDNYSEDVARRADLNVTKFRNFMFEMDGISLEDQERILEGCEIPWSTVVFSGGKSYHAILSLEVPLTIAPHNIDSLCDYKDTWARLAAKVDNFGRKLLDLDMSSIVVDKSCRNPSRFSRYPESYRESKGCVQSVKSLGSRISEYNFNALLESCPKVYSSKYVKLERPEQTLFNEDDFFEVASPSLSRAIKYAPFGAPSGMYRELFKLTLWAIDDTNIDKDLLIDIYNKYTFRRLVENYNYPSYKLMTPVEHALRMKGLL